MRVVPALEKPKAQVEMLQEIASVLQNSLLVEELLKENTYEGIIERLELQKEIKINILEDLIIWFILWRIHLILKSQLTICSSHLI